jgi:hypothetical protein
VLQLPQQKQMIQTNFAEHAELMAATNRGIDRQHMLKSQGHRRSLVYKAGGAGVAAGLRAWQRGVQRL